MVADADEHALPALQGALLAFQTAALADPDAVPVDLVLVDVGEDPAAVETILSDPTFVAAIVAPGDEVDVPEGIPMLSLSGLVATSVGVASSPPSQPSLASSRGASGTRRASCRMTRRRTRSVRSSPGGRASRRTPSRPPRRPRWSPSVDVEPWCGREDRDAGPTLRSRSTAPASASRAGTDCSITTCRRRAPGGGSAGVLPLRRRDDLDGSRREWGGSSRTTSRSTDPRMAAYAVEGWDAARLVLRAVRETAATRQEVGAWPGGRGRPRRLASTYQLGTDGEPDPESTVRIYRVVGGRWVGAGIWNLPPPALVCEGTRLGSMWS